MPGGLELGLLGLWFRPGTHTLPKAIPLQGHFLISLFEAHDKVALWATMFLQAYSHLVNKVTNEDSLEDFTVTVMM